jgi:hypothetical protein|tara:strand:+ start:83 stop:289 length:207 start_codon:yes stop_codon:yes gene_type:complete
MMDNFIIFVYFFFFTLVFGAAFAFMWKSMDRLFDELDRPIRREIHPEMKDVRSGEELLVFKVIEKEED